MQGWIIYTLRHTLFFSKFLLFMNVDEQKCIWENGCENNHSCVPGTYCQLYDSWSQCVEIPIEQPQNKCIGLINGASSDAKYGCDDQTPCCNPGAMCYADGHCHLPCAYTSVTTIPIEPIIETINNGETRTSTKHEEDTGFVFSSVACLGRQCVNDATKGPHCESGSYCVESTSGKNYCREKKIENTNTECAFTVDALHSQDLSEKTVNHECKSNMDCCNPDAHCVLGKGSKTGICLLSCSANYAQYHGYTVKSNQLYATIANKAGLSMYHEAYLPMLSVCMGLLISAIIIYIQRTTMRNPLHQTKRKNKNHFTEMERKIEKKKEKEVSYGDDCGGFSIAIDDEELR